MRKKKLLTAFGFILLFSSLIPKFTTAQNSTAPVTSLELKNGERVVFLGNSIFENDYQYGYLELALTTRFPNRDITFRNLGWTGDNVFGDARTNFTKPPSAYELLLQHITKAQPTLVFVAYGGIEAQEGEAGLPVFNDGLNKLLDKIDELGAKAILLSPIPVMGGDSAQHVLQRNEMIRRYAAEIGKIAATRGKQFIDIYTPIQEISKKAVITDNGVHLNEAGYYYLASTLEKALGLTPKAKSVGVTFSKNAAEITPNAKVVAQEAGNLKFTFDESYLPLPVPKEGKVINEEAQVLTVKGLKKGVYSLTIDNVQVACASAGKWAEGVEITQGPAFTQVHQLQELIIKKNEQFFFQYRPLNRTYILGFRSYEQGRHLKGLEEQSIIIKWLEGQIALDCKPRSRVYQLSLVK